MWHTVLSWDVTYFTVLSRDVWHTLLYYYEMWHTLLYYHEMWHTSLYYQEMCDILYCTIMRCVTYFTVLSRDVWHTLLYYYEMCDILYCTIMRCDILYCTVKRCDTLYSTIKRSVTYCTVLSWDVWHTSAYYHGMLVYYHMRDILLYYQEMWYTWVHKMWQSLPYIIIMRWDIHFITMTYVRFLSWEWHSLMFNSRDRNYKIDEDLKIGLVMLRYILFLIIMQRKKGRFKYRTKDNIYLMFRYYVRTF